MKRRESAKAAKQRTLVPGFRLRLQMAGSPVLLPRLGTQPQGFFFSEPSERVSKMPSPGELRTGYRQPASGAELDSGIGTNRLSTYEAKRASPPSTRGPGNRMNLEKQNLSGTSGDGWTYTYPQALT